MSSAASIEKYFAAIKEDIFKWLLLVSSEKRVASCFQVPRRQTENGLVLCTFPLQYLKQLNSGKKRVYTQCYTQNIVRVQQPEFLQDTEKETSSPFKEWMYRINPTSSTSNVLPHDISFSVFLYSMHDESLHPLLASVLYIYSNRRAGIDCSSVYIPGADT